MNKVLVIAAHPDDEVLGCGGTIVEHTCNGDEVHVLFLSDGISSRDGVNNAKEIDKRNHAAYASCEILGVKKPVFLNCPDNRMDELVLLDIVKKIENHISNIKPNIIYTHHIGDLNVDHQITHKAVITSCRPQPNFCVKEIYSFEVLSSTEWASPNSNNTFIPNYFKDIAASYDTKIKALKEYDEEMRSFPHSRSYDAVECLAKFRGASVGVEVAEAFQVVRLIK